MPNESGLLGNQSATQSGLSVAIPGQNTFYYIFTVDANENSLTNISNTLSVFPNSVTNDQSIYISGILPENVTLTLYDINGKIIKNSYINNNTETLNFELKNVDVGIYFLRILQNNSTKIAKIIIEYIK